MAEAAAKKPGWRTLARAMRNRKTGFMALFGFASGLPFALFLGTLYAWLTEAEVDLETMGVFSLIGLAYAFQFLWSPVIDKVDIAGFRKLGKRKQWIVPAQILLGAILVTMSLLDPGSALGLFSLLAGIGAFASATQDIAINAWRIDVADEEATLDILSTIYQMGYRMSSLVGGALGRDLRRRRAHRHRPAAGSAPALRWSAGRPRRRLARNDHIRFHDGRRDDRARWRGPRLRRPALAAPRGRPGHRDR